MHLPGQMLLLNSIKLLNWVCVLGARVSQLDGSGCGSYSMPCRTMGFAL